MPRVRALWYAKDFCDSCAAGVLCGAVQSASGNNSVVECDLAKVEVAGSNPVSRSNLVLKRRVRRTRPSKRVAFRDATALSVTSALRRRLHSERVCRRPCPWPLLRVPLRRRFAVDSAPRASVAAGPLHPAWRNSLRSRFAGRSLGGSSVRGGEPNPQPRNTRLRRRAAAGAADSTTKFLSSSSQHGGPRWSLTTLARPNAPNQHVTEPRRSTSGFLIAPRASGTMRCSPDRQRPF